MQHVPKVHGKPLGVIGSLFKQHVMQDLGFVFRSMSHCAHPLLHTNQLEQTKFDIFCGYSFRLYLMELKSPCSPEIKRYMTAHTVQLTTPQG